MYPVANKRVIAVYVSASHVTTDLPTCRAMAFVGMPQTAPTRLVRIMLVLRLPSQTMCQPL